MSTNKTGYKLVCVSADYLRSLQVENDRLIATQKLHNGTNKVYAEGTVDTAVIRYGTELYPVSTIDVEATVHVNVAHVNPEKLIGCRVLFLEKD